MWGCRYCICRNFLLLCLLVHIFRSSPCRGVALHAGMRAVTDFFCIHACIPALPLIWMCAICNMCYSCRGVVCRDEGCNRLFLDPSMHPCAALNMKEKEKRKTAQAAKHSLHEFRKRRHIGLNCRESPSPKSLIWMCAICNVCYPATCPICNMCYSAMCAICNMCYLQCVSFLQGRGLQRWRPRGQPLFPELFYWWVAATQVRFSWFGVYLIPRCIYGEQGKNADT